MKCLYCGKEAIPSEIYDGVQLYECEEKHRTGIIIDAQEDSEDKKALKVA